MRDAAKKKACDARRHSERMLSDLDYRMRKLLNTINARCKSGKGRADWEWYGGKGIQNFLTVDDMKVLWQRDNAAAMQRPTIDRRDSADDYNFDNCQFIELADNLRKMIPTRKPRRWYRKPTGERQAS
jgi:hypothetical protein